MTGFGSAAGNDFTVEIRSLNHRHIDISIKMPPYMSQYEIPLRNILKGKFQRGKFDVYVNINTDKVPQLKINKDLAGSIYSALLDLQKQLSLPGTISIETLTGYREIMIEEEPHFDTDALHAAFHAAVSNLEAMRMREGSLLSDEIRGRIALLLEMHDEIKVHAPEEVIKWRKKFTERLSLIVEAGMIDNNRIVQEAALMAEKLDISEEINRTENHLKQFVEILDNKDVVGKRLDFLLQELNREVNTLANKSGEYSISKVVIDMKTEIEKIREQVQNIQ